MAEETKSYTTPLIRMIFSSLDKASAPKDSQSAPKFSVKGALLVDDLTDLDKKRFKAILDDMTAQAKKKWPKSFEDGKLVDSDLVLGLRRPNTKELTHNDWLTRKHWILTASRGEKIGAPDLIKLVKGGKVPLKDAKEFYNGCFIRFTISSFYEFDNKSYGITFNLGNVAFAGHGEKIVSKLGTSGVDDFGDLGDDELKFDEGPKVGGDDEELDL